MRALTGGVRALVRAAAGASFILFSSLASAHSGGDGEPGKIYRFRLKNYQQDMRKIADAGFDVAGVNVRQQIVDLVLSEESLATATTRLGLRLMGELDGGVNDLDDEYHNPVEIEAELKALAARYSEIATVSTIGKSHQGRDIWAIKISDKVNESEASEPAILFNGMHHAREVMTPEVAMDTANYLLTRYAEDMRVRHWVNSNEIWIVPMLNPDGNQKVWDSDRWWRKNTREDYGVDLNRNYPYAWGTCNGSSGSKFSDTYRGPSAGSEPESQALMNLVSRIRPVFDISYHSYSELVIYPFGCDGVRTATQEVVETIGQKMASLLPSDSSKGENYSPGTAWELLYAVDGGDIDWMHGTFGVIPYVIEVNSTGEGFQPSYSQWREKTVTKLRPAWQLLLDRLDESGIRGVVNLNSGRPASDVSVKVESVSNPSLSPRSMGLKSDGTFHLVLTPGTYTVTVSDGRNTLPPESIQVSARRSDVEFDF